MIPTIVFCGSILGVITASLIRCGIRHCDTSHRIYTVEDLNHNLILDSELIGNDNLIDSID